MDLAELQRHWDAFGHQDPLWAILTDPARKGGRWDVGEFFATGDAEVQALIDAAAAFGLPQQRRRGLDFGCGVGRLTQALAAHVEEALGLDVAPSMIAHARGFNRHGDRVRYDVQAAPPLAVASRSVDVVVTGRVLQHIAPEFSRRYVSELARVLAPGGFMSFDVPGRPIEPKLPAGAMPASAYRARLAARRRAVTGDVVTFDVEVANASDLPWVAGQALNLGSHWLAADGAVVAFDGPRAALPLPLGPGDSTVVVYELPDAGPGDARALELDLVHEGVTWFGWTGSPTVRIAVNDGQGEVPGPERPPSGGGFEPVMEMHAIPRDEVEALLRDAGVRLLRVRPESHCGPRWEAWRYDVTTDTGD